jgi:hypothetical protein
MSATITEWNQREVIEAVASDVEEKLTMAGQLVEGKARTNLTRVKIPEWGRKYRWALAFTTLTSFVQRKGKTIEAHIGMGQYSPFTGKVSSHYGFYIEMGSSKFSAHPWLRPALLQNVQNIRRILGS